MSSIIKNTADLRNMLLETIQGVRRGKIDPKQASAISGLSSQILKSARLDFDMMKLSANENKADAPKSVSLIGKETKAIGRSKKAA